MGSVGISLLLTALAGLSTGIGGCIALLAKRGNQKFLSASLGFSAGVMIYVSMIEIFQEAQSMLTASLGQVRGSWATPAAFFAGMLFIAAIDQLIPAELSGKTSKPAGLLRIGLLTALAIGIHNFPEGLATFVSAQQTPEVAIPIVIAIALHNIPEGIAVSGPIYQATGSRRKALGYAFLSGLAEPVGALIGWLVLMPVMNDTVFGLLFAAVAGIMVFISLDELLPAARAYGHHHLSIYGLIAGMAVMAASLLLFM